ncbi:MAG: GDYXXLXY domain-containing protein [Planctomycetes bacterium]|nr:GDYXXLXY domain-containing protein [Planctomycetota bacterium]
MSTGVRYWAAIVPSFLAVAAIALQAEWTLRAGREVLLEVRAYDPMDALSGRYLAVPLAIERLPAERFSGPPGRSAAGERVWVRLEPGEPTWSAAEILAEPPAGAELVALRATLVRQDPREVWLDYELDRFFVPQEAADPTLPRGARRIVAVVRVTRDGRGALADLLVDGERYAAWNARQPR